MRMTAHSGRKCSGSLKKSGPIGFVVKTLLASSQWRSTVCYLTWKVQVTPANRLYFQLAPSTPRTAGTGYSLLPTPTSQNAKHGEATEWEIENRPNHLHVIARLWPTPRAGKTTDENEETWLIRQAAGKVSTPPLTLAVKMWPFCGLQRGGYTDSGEWDIREGLFAQSTGSGAIEPSRLVADPQSPGQSRGERDKQAGRDEFNGCSEIATNPSSQGLEIRPGQTGERTLPTIAGSDWWSVEPDMGRVAHGVRARVDRLRALGNTVVPQKVYPILKAIADYELQESTSKP
jgi:hypothetical protein